MDMKNWNTTRLSPEEVAEYLSKQSSGGILHYKYIPKTGEWGKPDVSYATLTPLGDSNAVVKKVWRGEGTVQFHEATWEDLPTMFNIVNTFHNLEIKEYRGAMIVKTVGGKDLGDQRILR